MAEVGAEGGAVSKVHAQRMVPYNEIDNVVLRRGMELLWDENAMVSGRGAYVQLAGVVLLEFVLHVKVERGLMGLHISGR